jgi:hypothetical protein
MSKKIRQLIVLLVVVVLIGAMTIALALIPVNSGNGTSSDPGTSSSGSAKTEYLYQYKEDEVKAFTLKNENGTFQFTAWFNEEQNRMNYQIIGYEGIDFLDSMPGRVAAFAEELQVIRWIGEKENLSEYGLTEEKAVRLQVSYTDGTSVDVLIGDSLNSNEKHRYAVEAGKNKVFVVEVEQLLSISAKTLLPSMLLSIQAIDAEENLQAPDFYSIRISGRDHKKPLEIFRVDQLEGIDESNPLNNAVYYIADGDAKHPVLPEATTTFLSDMCLIQSTGVAAIKPTDAQKKQYGFDNPIVLEVRVVAMFDEEDGTPEQIDDYKIYIGKIEKNVAYAMVPNREVIYEIDPACVKTLTMDAYEMREKVLYMLSGTAIQELKVTGNGKVYDFLRERIKNESVNSATGATDVSYEYKTYYNDELMSQYNNFYAQFLAAFSEGPVTEATQKGELLLQVDMKHFEEMAKESTQIRIYACEDERRVLYEADGVLMGYARKTWVNKVLSDVEDLIQGKKITITY